jgi:sulfate adenylyltransferase/3'-phosphoadenosine 5'-phosphosulfate synthase
VAAATSTRPNGATVWFTGLPSAGKTTVATLVGERLAELGHPVEVLDGDVVRTRLSRGLGFSRSDRDENIRRIGYVAGLLTSHGVTVLVSAISPYRAVRDEVRAAVERVGGFVEVHAATDLATCRAQLDPDRAGTSPAVGRAPDREGSRYPEAGRTAVHSPHPHDSHPHDSHPHGPTPHGGRLTERLVPPDLAEGLAAEAARLPAVVLDGRGLADLECLAVGAFSPLTGFLGAADHTLVVEHGRLADGTVWTLPVVLPVLAEVLAGGPDRLALTDVAGTVLAVVDVEEVHEPDPGAESKLVVETDDPAHPGVAATLARRGPLVGGPVQVLRLPATPAELGPRLTPAQVRAEAAARGWRSMAGFQTRNPVHRAHEYLHKVALEHVDGLLLHPLVGETKGDDVPATLRMACYRVLLDGYYPPGRVLLSAFPAAMRYAGPREAVFHALVRKNYGCTHFIVGRDHAGVGSWYGTYAAQEAFDAYDPGELGIQPLKYEHAFFCRRCEAMVTSRTCPHPAETRVHLSGTAVRDLLAKGQLPPPQFSRPEVAQLLADGYRARGG